MLKNWIICSGAIATTVSASSNSTLCTSDHVKASLPSLTGIEYGAITAASVTNLSVTAGNNYPASSGRNFCNVSIAYSHTNANDSVSSARYKDLPTGADYG